MATCSAKCCNPTKGCGFIAPHDGGRMSLSTDTLQASNANAPSPEKAGVIAFDGELTNLRANAAWWNTAP